MKISTKGRYALRLMLDIAANEGEKPIRIKDIANRIREALDIPSAETIIKENIL